MANITIPGLVIICGYQGSGKSHLIRYIMYQNRKKFDWGIVFSNTEFVGTSFNYIDPRFVHSQFNETALVKMKEIHEGLVRGGKKPSGFVIFDDCLFGTQWKNKEFLSLMTQLRHYGITCILSCQYPQSIPPVFRANAFQVAMFYTQARPALKAMYESYGQMFDNLNDFKKFLNDNTGDHGFVMYNARANDPTIESRYQVMKCPAEIPDFMIKYSKKK